MIIHEARRVQEIKFVANTANEKALSDIQRLLLTQVTVSQSGRNQFTCSGLVHVVDDKAEKTAGLSRGGWLV